MNFSKETFDFLIENRLQNSKEWFNGHKEQYNKYVIAPLVSLTERLAPVLLDIDPALNCSPKVGGAISRIWRDVRFSKDKSLFRDSMWLSFVRRKAEGLPEFFFVVSPECLMYGAGYYMTPADSMRSIRELIINGDAEFKAAKAAFDNQSIFRLDGDMYGKSKHPDAPEELKAWLDRKTICFIRESGDFDLLYSDKLFCTLAESYRILAPVYRFLIKAEEIKN